MTLRDGSTDVCNHGYGSEADRSTTRQHREGTDLDGDRQPVVPEGLEAEAARLLGGLPDGHQVPGTLQVQRHALHQLQRGSDTVRGDGS